jgi:glycosyltransferase involved in cell wall biosynthesis
LDFLYVVEDSVKELTPVVSVIIPVYNGGAHLGVAIESVLRQTYTNLEVIVVDDGSTDDSTRIAKSFGSRVRVMTQPNSGSAVARNAGIDYSHGELIAFIDADDAWVSHKLELQVNYLSARPDVGMVYHSWVEWNGDQALLAELETQAQQATLAQLDWSRSGWIYHQLLLDSIVHTSTAMIRRTTIAAVGGFDPQLRRGQDYDYWLRVSRITEIHKLAATLSVYRIHDASITNRLPARNGQAEIVTAALQRWGPVGPDGSRARQTKLRRVLAARWLSFGGIHFEKGDATVARTSTLRALKIWPLSLSGWWLLFRILSARRSSE